MAGVASAPGGSGGGSGGGFPPRKPEPPIDVPDDDEEEEVEDEEVGVVQDEAQAGRRVQCPTCLRWVLRSIGLARHASKCVGHRRFVGDFACVSPGCKVRRSYYHDLTKHWRKIHGGEVPAAIKAYVP